jgi:hypothetical protein
MAAAKRSAKAAAKPCPPGHHRMPDGTCMPDSQMMPAGRTPPAKARRRAPAAKSTRRRY